MLDIIILAVFLIGLTVGLRRGFILQLIHMTGFIVAFIVAVIFYDDLAPKLELWIPFPSVADTSSITMLFDKVGIDQAYYNAIAFIIIFFVVKIAWQILGSMFDFLASFPILKTLNRWGGGILGFLETYLIMFILLYLAALLPVQNIQDGIQGSFFAEMMIKYTPILSDQIKDLWFSYISA
ncbi:CvpA family protein [Bacillus massiliigorillae]|uniref:CvpA family protein n=1 Tax=Bacillus massiliigorillae TaxID=1243664 RepID=UPI0003A3B10B|nr:CvpA family protein [Bacillus massiliigorillae]